jgi:hypothetical protein
MSTLAISSQTPATLRHLREYVALYQLYKSNTNENQLPPLSHRITFKQCESSLPTGLLQYIHWHLTHGCHNPLTIMDEKGRCSNCKEVTHPEWRTSILRGEIIFVCGRCRRIFVPNYKNQEVVA